jgi:hypothetical protein
MLAAAGSRAATTLLSNSIFLITFGSNDLFVFTAAKKQQQQSDAATAAAAALVADLIANYSAAIRELYVMGARKFTIINLGVCRWCVRSTRLVVERALTA